MQSTNLFEKEAIFLNMSKILGLMQRANNFLCDWVIAGIHKDNDRRSNQGCFICQKNDQHDSHE